MSNKSNPTVAIQPVGFALDHIEDLLFRGVQKLLGVDRANSVDSFPRWVMCYKGSSARGIRIDGKQG
jgi:hypothetical protein